MKDEGGEVTGGCRFQIVKRFSLCVSQTWLMSYIMAHARTAASLNLMVSLV
jgi:hypothetical protein